ncbi:MAG TPA: hypothetical protein VL401_00070 [Alphaproteobacteria bacterium]|jgi:hypothetical protein|nr:hypothetical protein [Alphaproteobacteria bacterium]
MLTVIGFPQDQFVKILRGDLITAVREAISISGNNQIAAAVQIKNTVFLAASGGAKITLSRNGVLSPILTSQEKLISASGPAKFGDVFILEANNLNSTLIVEKPKTFEFTFLNKLLQKLPKKQIYVNPVVEDDITSDNKKLTFSVGLILLIILAVSIGFGVHQKKVNDTKKQYGEALKQVQDSVDQAISLASISPDKSRELFFDSEQKLTQIETLKIKDDKIGQLRQKINDSKAAVLGQYEVTPEFFLDLSLLSSGFTGDSLSLSNGNIFVLDKKGLKVVSVGVATKKSKVVAGPNVIDSAFDLASYSDKTFVLASDGIYDVGKQKTKVIDKTWSGEALIKAFAGNFYVLDKSGNTIYRYAGVDNTFGEQHIWLASGTNVDFSNVKSWMIDGSAYVLLPNSKIQKFSLGSPQSFKISGVVPEIGTVDAMYADADTQYLYFLDKVGKRIVVTDKKGNYKAQYMGDEIGNASNFVVSESDKKIMLLSGDKLLSIEMKHL